MVEGSECERRPYGTPNQLWFCLPRAEARGKQNIAPTARGLRLARLHHSWDCAPPGPFEGSPTIKPPALTEDTYSGWWEQHIPSGAKQTAEKGHNSGTCSE
jgi:hypothetical protein